MGEEAELIGYRDAARRHSPLIGLVIAESARAIAVSIPTDLTTNSIGLRTCTGAMMHKRGILNVALGRPGRTVITPLGRFESTVKAAVAHGLNPSHGYFRAKRQVDGWHFEDEPRRSRRKWAIAVITPDGDFNTVSAAARHHHVCFATVDARIQRGEQGWHYTDPAAGWVPREAEKPG